MARFSIYRISTLLFAFALLGSLFLPANTSAAPEGLSEKEAKAFDKQVKRYIRKTTVQKDRNDSTLEWVQTPEVRNDGARDSYYYIRAGLKGDNVVIAQVVLRKDYLSTQGIYDPASMKWNSAKSDGNPLLIDATVVTDRSYGHDIQYGFVKLSEPMLQQRKNEGFSVTVENTEHGDKSQFVVEPVLITAFLQKLSEQKK